MCLLLVQGFPIGILSFDRSSLVAKLLVSFRVVAYSSTVRTSRASVACYCTGLLWLALDSKAYLNGFQLPVWSRLLVVPLTSRSRSRTSRYFDSVSRPMPRSIEDR